MPPTVSLLAGHYSGMFRAATCFRYAGYNEGRRFLFLGTFRMLSAYFLVIACGLLALAYGWFTSRQVLAANAGTTRM